MKRNYRLYLTVLALTFYALVMGVLWGTWLSLSRSIHGLVATTYLEVGKTMIANLATPMRILMPLAILTTAALLVMQWHRLRVRWPLAFALLMMIGVLVITLTVEVPIDNEIKTWTLTTLPTTWETIRDRWEVHHTIRTILALAGFVSLSVASVLARSDDQSKK